MLYKLAFRNAKRSLSDYAVYLITVTLSFCLMFSFGLVASSDAITGLSEGMNTFQTVLDFIDIIILFVICFLINYTTKFMFTKRSRELGMYLLLGIRRGRVILMFLTEILLKHRRYFLDAGIELDVRIKDTVVFTDEKWLGFIFSQIIQNSVKYFDKPKKRLSIYSEESPASAVLVTEDNGCGISAADLPRVFEKGFTGSDRSKTASTGMGLYLAKTLCDRLGLGLTVQSREGEFTRVTVVFPKGTVHETDS